jgi:mannosyltransferase OCH1-like enzyme
MNIIQTYKTRNVPTSLRLLSEKVQRLHPSWNYKFFTDEDIVRFFNEDVPHLLETFKGLGLKIQQLDFFRYAVVHYYGGLYLDMDMDMTTPFDGMDLTKCYFPLEAENNGDPVLQKQNIRFLVGNYAFYAPKGHPFLEALMGNVAVQRISDQDIKEAQSKRVDKSDVYVFFTTGPVMVTQTYADVGKQNHVELLSPDPFVCGWFGKYGQHLMYGSWKRKILTKL